MYGGASMAPPFQYAELHCHTNYSFLDGASHPFELVARAAELGYTALGVVDHDGFRGAAKVHRAATHVGMPVVYGTEVGMPLDFAEVASRPKRRPEPQAPPTPKPRRGRIRRMHGSKPTTKAVTDHLVLLAPDPAGYAAISHFVTKGQYRGAKDDPKYSYAELEAAARVGNLVAFTGCWQGAVPRAAQAGDFDGALRAAAHLRNIFGNRLFIELWHHAMPEDDARNDLLAEVARRLSLQTVATNNVHYAERSQADLSEVLAAIGGRRSLDLADGFRPATDERYLRSAEEMAARFARYPGLLRELPSLGGSSRSTSTCSLRSCPTFPCLVLSRQRMNTYVNWQ